MAGDVSDMQQYQGAAADIKSAISTLAGVKGAEEIVEALHRSLAATRMLLHNEWQTRLTWISYPNGFLATIVKVSEDSHDGDFVWYVRPIGLINEQYGLPSVLNCPTCGPDVLCRLSGKAETFEYAKKKVWDAAEELLRRRSEGEPLRVKP